MAQTQVHLAYVSPASAYIQGLVASDQALLASAASFKPLRRKTYLSGRGLLKAVLIEQGLISSSHPLPPMDIGPSGKPFFNSPALAPNLLHAADGASAGPCHALHFNLSHSLDLIGLATGSHEQGIDLEVVRAKRLREPLIKRVLGGKELEYFNSLESESERALFFTQQWTLREALIKLTGMSIFQMDVISVDPYARTISSKSVPSGMVYCFILPKAAGSSRRFAAPATDASATALVAPVGAPAAQGSAPAAQGAAPAAAGAGAESLGELIDVGTDECADALLSVFVHQADVLESERMGISPVQLWVQRELGEAFGTQMCSFDANAGENATNGHISLYDHMTMQKCNLAVYTAFAVNQNPDA